MTRLGLALSGAGFLGAAAATDPVSLVLANLVLGAGLGAVYAAATAALAATDDPDKASAVTVSGVVGVTALLIRGVPAANHDLGEGTGFLLMALCCLLARPLVRRLPDGPAAPTAPDAGRGSGHLPAGQRPRLIALLRRQGKGRPVPPCRQCVGRVTGPFGLRRERRQRGPGPVDR